MKIKKKSPAITSTLMILGIALNNACIDTYNPSFLEINLRGFNTLNNLRTLRNYKWTWGNDVHIIEIIVIKKSVILEVLLK
jgi:hypothetical protein